MESYVHKRIFRTMSNIYDGAFFTSVKPYFKNVLNSIELSLGSIFERLTLSWKSLQLWILREMILWRWLLESVTEVLVYFYNISIGVIDSI